MPPDDDDDDDATLPDRIGQGDSTYAPNSAIYMVTPFNWAYSTDLDQ